MLVEHIHEFLGVDRILLLPRDIGCHLFEHRHQGTQALLQRGLACQVGLNRGLPLELFGRGHALVGQELDLVCLLLLAVKGLACQRDLPTQLIEMLLHGAQLRLARRLGVPTHECLDTGLYGLIHLYAKHVLDEFQHGETSFGCIKSEPWSRR